MTDNTQEIDVILAVFANYDDSYEPGYEEGVLNRIERAKQALLDWHNKRELEARIDTLEYAKISPKFKIEEKIGQLRLELNKYE